MVMVQASGPLQIRVFFETAVTDYLWIESRLAGWEWSRPNGDGITFRFIPEDADGERNPVDIYPASHTDENGFESFGAALLEVRVDIPPTVSQWETRDSITYAVGQARELVAGFFAWCKIEQPWIGPYDTPPEPQGEVVITELDTGHTYSERLRYRRGRPEGPAVRPIDGPSLDLDDVEGFLERSHTGVMPEAAEAFLADAYFGAFCSQPRDLKRALLLAAFACEIHTRQALAEHVRPANRDQFEQWFPQDRQSRRRVAEWVGPVAKALVGRSLEDEDTDLYTSFGNLIEMRNRLAHRGELAALAEVLEGVRAARRVFDWLASW